MASPADPLASLRPLHTPPPVSWWPPAPGWWLLAALTLLALALVFLHYRRTRMQRAALRELAALAASGLGGSKLAAQLAALLKRYAVFCYPAGGVANLTGEPWLRFLDAHGGKGAFRTGCGRALGNDLFQPGAEPDVAALLALARRWIKNNRRRR